MTLFASFFHALLSPFSPPRRMRKSAYEILKLNLRRRGGAQINPFAACQWLSPTTKYTSQIFTHFFPPSCLPLLFLYSHINYAIQKGKTNSSRAAVKRQRARDWLVVY
jgi:hypothetical protein